MDTPKGYPRYPRLGEDILLTQTDTTVGFLSQNKEKLLHIKNRPQTKPFLVKLFTLTACKEHIRFPRDIKNRVRRAKKTTFVVKNQAFRVAKPKTDSLIFNKLKWCYSTSANEHKKNFDYNFAFSQTNLLIQNNYPLKEEKASTILLVGKRKIRKIR